MKHLDREELAPVTLGARLTCVSLHASIRALHHSAIIFQRGAEPEMPLLYPASPPQILIGHKSSDLTEIVYYVERDLLLGSKRRIYGQARHDLLDRHGDAKLYAIGTAGLGTRAIRLTAARRCAFMQVHANGTNRLRMDVGECRAGEFSRWKLLYLE